MRYLKDLVVSAAALMAFAIPNYASSTLTASSSTKSPQCVPDEISELVEQIEQGKARLDEATQKGAREIVEDSPSILYYVNGDFSQVLFNLDNNLGYVLVDGTNETYDLTAVKDGKLDAVVPYIGNLTNIVITGADNLTFMTDTGYMGREEVREKAGKLYDDLQTTLVSFSAAFSLELIDNAKPDCTAMVVPSEEDAGIAKEFYLDCSPDDESMTHLFYSGPELFVYTQTEPTTRVIFLDEKPPKGLGAAELYSAFAERNQDPENSVVINVVQEIGRFEPDSE